MAEESYQERTEKPTERRISDARKEGRVPRSRELNTAVLLLLAAAAFSWQMPAMASDVRNFFVDSFAWWTPSDDFGPAEGARLLEHALNTLLSIVGPILVFFAGILLSLSLAQSRGALSLKPLTPNFSNLDPIRGLRQIFGLQGVVNAIKQILKLAVIGTIGYLTIRSFAPEILSLVGASPVVVLENTLRFSVRIMAIVASVYLVVALGDYAYEAWRHERSLYMTREEVKRELKDTEGDPLIKQRIRSIMRQMARRRMMADVPKADFVIVNPTHRAVALRYDPATDIAPIVLAMGERKIALRIRQIAEEHGIPIVENPPLAAALIRTAKVGHPIPVELYKAVAEVVAFVYRSRNTYLSRLSALN